ncbi:hypothetical protein [Mesorhizobium sp. L48C026A00]|uniref:hypothetical protein n=1 Tax=Mesorhizobium sp. L48C026A00 TaxID=1287182 RepID=UPI0003D0675C|nr:hypothetical protein [Mesorhizobium sp. L48C026A00]ESZ19915.1 hypothetical protein X737_12195 [Mesorhizobium sp. L48C026A00]
MSVAGDKIPAFAYVVCDITPSMHAELKMSDAMPTLDQRSYYGYHWTFGIYSRSSTTAGFLPMPSVATASSSTA